MNESRAVINRIVVVGDEGPLGRLARAQFDTIVSANAVRALMALLCAAQGGTWGLLNCITELDLEYLVKAELIRQPRPGTVLVL